MNESLQLTATTPGFQIGLVGAGVFLLWGMALGVWKFWHMRQPPTHRAPIYVDIAHRAALLYGFASLLLAALAQFSAWPEALNTAAVIINLIFFTSAVLSYVAHGWRKTGQTQYRQRNFITGTGTWLLIVGELGATALLLAGVIRAAIQ